MTASNAFLGYAPLVVIKTQSPSLTVASSAIDQTGHGGLTLRHTSPYWKHVNLYTDLNLNVAEAFYKFRMPSLLVVHHT
jgi:hypothetical protein